METVGFGRGSDLACKTNSALPSFVESVKGNSSTAQPSVKLICRLLLLLLHRWGHHKEALCKQVQPLLIRARPPLQTRKKCATEVY